MEQAALFVPLLRTWAGVEPDFVIDVSRLTAISIPVTISLMVFFCLSIGVNLRDSRVHKKILGQTRSGFRRDSDLEKLKKLLERRGLRHKISPAI
jgi:hypothetical protein